MRLSLIAVCVITFATVASSQDTPLVWQRFKVDDRPAFVILPDEAKRTDTIPWVFYAPTFDRSLPNANDEGWMIRRFLESGIAIAGIDVGESYGNAQGCKMFDALSQHVVSKFKFDNKACLLARSRGGLMLYNWAAENPDKVRCIAGIYPVCNLVSYPGLKKACGAYGMTESELAAMLSDHNPIDRLEPLARAGIPIFHIHGDVDKVVPLEANSAVLAQRYKQLGGSMKLVIAPDQGHNMWRGFFECNELVEFVLANAAAGESAPQVLKDGK